MARRRVAAVAGPSRSFTASLLRLIRGILILAGVLLVVLAVLAGMLTYHVLSAQDNTETVTPATYLLSNYVSLDFQDKSGGEHQGWLLLGLRGAPVIILCHGYNSNRSDMLSLGTVLRENHFNVYVFNFSGPKAKENLSDLGARQTEDLLAAIATLSKQPTINPHRVGLFGTTLGAFAALAAAEQNPMVRAVAVDNVYEKPLQFFDTQIDETLGGSSPAFRLLTHMEFRLFAWGSKPYPVRANLSRLDNVPKLFISGGDKPALAKITEDLYNAAPQPKKLLVLERSQSVLTSGPEKNEYESQILNFFLQNLPLRAN
jgi:esterase/lipase